MMNNNNTKRVTLSSTRKVYADNVFDLLGTEKVAKFIAKNPHLRSIQPFNIFHHLN